MLIRVNWFKNCSTGPLGRATCTVNLISAKSRKELNALKLMSSQNFWPFWVKIIVILLICSALTAIIFFSAWNESQDISANSQLLNQMPNALLFQSIYCLQKTFFASIANLLRKWSLACAQVYNLSKKKLYFDPVFHNDLCRV